MKCPVFIPKSGLKVCSVLFSALLLSCGGAADENEDTPEVDDVLTASQDYIDITGSVPQNPSDQSPEGLAKFAWEQFIALNWQASWGQPGEATDLRGTFDRDWNPATDSYADTYEVVWETYAHVTELRPGDDHMLPFDTPPHYSYIKFRYNGHGVREGLDSTLFNNLDEDSEIGSCNIYPPGTVIGDTPTELVLYQAKTNRDEYDYVLNNYPTVALLKAASDKNQANILADSAYYPGATSTCDCPKEEGVICLPCGGAPNPSGGTYEGAIEVKTAWRKVKDGENTSSFFTRNCIYYVNNPGSSKLPYYDNGLFALIGIHIIHKTKDNPEFVFASWEHVGVESQPYQLQLLDNNGDVVGNPRTYQRYAPVPSYLDEVTDSVHQLITDKYEAGFGIWKNYRLIGVQGQATDYANRATDPNYFMANYVIESDTSTYGSPGKPGLANFHGFGFADNPFYVDNNFNTLISAENKFVDAGGCIGCHGVAQTTEGTDFSFLLDYGEGKPVKNPATINSITPAQKTYLKQYISKMTN